MLGVGYLIIDGVAYTPSDFEYEIKPIEDVNLSEAGTELINATRLDKHVFQARWDGIDSTLKDQLLALCLKPYVEVKLEGETFICRARGANPKLLKKTYLYRKSNGLWNVSLTLTQI